MKILYFLRNVDDYINEANSFESKLAQRMSKMYTQMMDDISKQENGFIEKQMRAQEVQNKLDYCIKEVNITEYKLTQMIDDICKREIHLLRNKQ